jgi:hypothetical protein
VPRGIDRGIKRLTHQLSSDPRPQGRHSAQPTGLRSRLGSRLGSRLKGSRVRPVALVTAPLVTALAVGVGVLTSGSTLPDAPSARSSTTSISDAAPSSGEDATAETRTLGTSRSTQRVPLVDRRVPRATGKLWTTTDLDLRIEPREKSRVAGTMESGKRIDVTGREQGAYAEVITGRVTRWVTAEHLSRTKEVQPGSMGLVDRPCPGTEGTESGLTGSAVRVYRAVCNNFPQITSYGGYDGHGEHASGRAIDIMTSDTGVGTRIAEFLRANAGALNLYDVIWQQRIWTPQRGGEGWRSMEDRGSSTANHFDHVHVSVN